MKPGKELLFLALGGSGEIGMNVNLYGCDGKWLMVDCGITFADPSLPGVDVILPDLSFIEDRLDDLVGIVLTHGHEDHIGALPYLAQDLGVPLYAAPFTAGLIRDKLDSEGVSDKVRLKIVQPNKPYKLGPFTVEHIPLAHSIPEGNALVIDTPYGRVFHSGDWKLDEDPVLGSPSTGAELEAIGDRGVLALMCDSTNVFNDAASGSESAVREGLDAVIGAAEGRVLVTTFASNAARLHTLGQVAQDTGRQLVVAGRSLDRIIRVAQAAGYLKDFPPTVDFDRAMKLPARDVMIIATGGQGEARAALARVASGSHQLKLGKGDLVVFSSKQIPGNETAIGRIQNQLAGAGVQMITDRQAHVHVSGHPGRPELELMYKWIRPEILVPVHGELRHLTEHARFAMEKGIRRAVVQENGSLIRLAPGAPSLVSHEPVGRLVIDGDIILPADGSTMQERKRVAAYGQVSVAAAIDKRGKLAGAPQIRTQGLPVEEDRDDFIAEAVASVEEALGGGAKGDKLQEAVRLAVRRTAVRWTGKKPVVDVMLLGV